MRFHSKRGHASPVNPALRRGGASATVQLRRPRARPLLVGTPCTASATSPARSGTRSNASLPEQARAVVVRPKSSREQDGSMAAHHQFGWLRDGSGVACTMHVPRMYLARTWLAPPNLLPSTWLVPALHHACTWLQAALARISAFCFLLSALARWWLWVALPRLSAFCILHSAFVSGWLWGRIRVALGSHWGSIGVALGSQWGAYQLAINTLWGGSDVALMSH
jgi:hypothetical protein